MGIQLGSAYGKVALDVKGLLDAVKQGKTGMMQLAAVGEQVGDGMKRAGQALTIGLTVPIAALGVASIKTASDFEETKNKAMVAFEDMADSVVSNANRAATQVGLSKTQYLDYASTIAAALKAGGMSVVESTQLSEEAVKHFADLASFHNAQVEEVAAAWQSAIRGQYEPIQRYFPFINDAYMKTYGVANGLVDQNTKNLTANQRALILNAIALDEKLNPALNDFAETSGGLANQQRILRAEWQNALIMLGQNLLPMALKVVSAFNSLLEKFNALSPVQQQMIIGFLGILAAAGPVLTVFGTLVSTASRLAGVASGLSQLGITFGSLSTALTTVAPAAAAIGTALVPVLIVLAGIGFYVGILYIMWRTNFLGMRDNVTMFVKVFKALWAALLAFLRGDTDAALKHVGEALEAFKERFAKFGSMEQFKAGWNIFINWLKSAVQGVVTFLSKAFSNVNWATIGKYILSGLANGLLGGLPNLLIIATKIAKDLLAQIKKTLGIASDSKEAIKLGFYTGHGYTTGFQQGLDPNVIARGVARSVNNFASSNQQNISMQFANGITTRQVQSMIADNNEQLMGTLINALGGA
jgi:hypothetical protein